MEPCEDPEVLESTGQTCRYAVTAQEKACRGRECLPAGARPAVSVFACKDDESKVRSSVDRRLLVTVKELLYPGRQSRDIADKWIYVICEGKYVAEIQAVSAKEWHLLRSPDPSQPNKQRQLKEARASNIDLDPGPAGKRHTYHFFLSPIRMSPKGLDYLLKAVKQSPKAFVHVSFDLLQDVVVVPDPFHWAVDASRCYYIPRLQQWQGWVQNADRQGKLFIASVLKSWIAGGDPVGVKNELKKGEPDRFLDAYRKEETKLRTAAERAAAYLCHCVDALDHRAVEISALESGGLDLSYCFQQWCCVCGNIIDTKPGQQFAAKVATDANRLPGQYVFGDASPPNALEFANYRHAWLAAEGIFSELLPALVRALDKSGVETEKLIDAALKKIQLNGLTKKHREIYAAFAGGNIDKAKSLLEKAPARPKGKLMRNWKSLLSELAAQDAKVPPSSVSSVGKAVDKVHADWSGVMAVFKYSLGTVLEVANFCLAVREYRDASPGDRGQKLVSLVGAGGDLSAFVASAVETLMKEGFGRRVVGSFAGGAAGIAGVCEMLDHEGKFVQAAIGEGDYSQAVGHGIATAGAAMTAVGGGLLLVKAVSGGALFGGPVGAIVGAIGAVLIIGGSLLARLLTHNQYELFGKFCFLGDDHDDDTHYYKWAPHGLPTSSIKHEVDVLLTLMSAFSVTGSVPLGDAYIMIKPGYLPDDAVFEVTVRNKWYAAGTLQSLARVHLSEDQIVQVSGATLSKGGGVTRDANGRVTGISVTVDHPGAKGSYLSFNTWVRLKLDEKGSLWNPVHRGWVKIDTIGDKNISSLDESHIVDDGSL